MDVLSKGGRDGKAEFFEATDDRAKDGDLIFIKPLVVKVNNESCRIKELSVREQKNQKCAATNSGQIPGFVLQRNFSFAGGFLSV